MTYILLSGSLGLYFYLVTWTVLPIWNIVSCIEISIPVLYNFLAIGPLFLTHVHRVYRILHCWNVTDFVVIHFSITLQLPLWPILFTWQKIFMTWISLWFFPMRCDLTEAQEIQDYWRTDEHSHALCYHTFQIEWDGPCFVLQFKDLRFYKKKCSG